MSIIEGWYNGRRVFADEGEDLRRKGILHQHTARPRPAWSSWARDNPFPQIIQRQYFDNDLPKSLSERISTRSQRYIGNMLPPLPVWGCWK